MTRFTFDERPLDMALSLRDCRKLVCDLVENYNFAEAGESGIQFHLVGRLINDLCDMEQQAREQSQ